MLKINLAHMLFYFRVQFIVLYSEIHFVPKFLTVMAEWEKEVHMAPKHIGHVSTLKL